MILTPFCFILSTFSTGQLLSQFLMHTGAVYSFIPFPASVGGSRMRGSILSVAKDNSLAIISLEELVCLQRFPSHPHLILRVHYKKFEDLLIVECLDETIFVWHLRTGYLDRTESGQVAEDILSGCDVQMR